MSSSALTTGQPGKVDTTRRSCLTAVFRTSCSRVAAWRHPLASCAYGRTGNAEAGRATDADPSRANQPKAGQDSRATRTEPKRCRRRTGRSPGWRGTRSGFGSSGTTCHPVDLHKGYRTEVAGRLGDTFIPRFRPPQLGTIGLRQLNGMAGSPPCRQTETERSLLCRFGFLLVLSTSLRPKWTLHP
jgi:hypothetical protein